MAQRRQPFDVHEYQRDQLAAEMREEAAAAAAHRGAPPRSPARRGAPPPARRGAPPPRVEGFAPRPVVAAAEAEWDTYAEDPADTVLLYDSRGPGPGRRNERGKGIDIHEILKQEAFGAPQAACDDHFEKNRPCPSGVYGISDQYVVLDSFNKLKRSRTDQGEFEWNFMVQGVSGDEVVGVRDRIDTVIEIQMSAFVMPIPPEVPYVLAPAPPVTPSGTNRLVLVHNNDNAPAGAPTLIPNTLGFGQYPPSVLLPPTTTLVPWVNNPYSQVPFGNRLTVQIKEAGLQSFSDRNGARHHFEFSATYIAGAVGLNPTMLQVVPLGGALWDTYIFTDPLKDVHGVTLVFRNPDVPIRFEPDCLYDIPVVSDGAAAPGPFLQFQAPGHGLSVGDRIFVQGFASGVPVLDAYMNRPAGHVVSGNPAAAPVPPGTPLAQAPAPGPYPDVFWTDPAVSIIDFAPAPVLPQIVTVCIAKRRIRIPVRLRRVVDRLTNYVAP